MHTRIATTCIVLAALFAWTAPAAAQGACNSAGCWSMKIFTLLTAADGKEYVTFEGDTIDPLRNGGAFTGCTVRLVSAQGGHPALLIDPAHPAAEQMKTKMLAAFSMRQRVGLGVSPGSVLAGGGIPYCVISSVYFYRTDCNNSTGVCQ